MSQDAAPPWPAVIRVTLSDAEIDRFAELAAGRARSGGGTWVWSRGGTALILPERDLPPGWTAERLVARLEERRAAARAP